MPSGAARPGMPNMGDQEIALPSGTTLHMKNTGGLMFDVYRENKDGSDVQPRIGTVNLGTASVTADPGDDAARNKALMDEASQNRNLMRPYVSTGTNAAAPAGTPSGVSPTDPAAFLAAARQATQAKLTDAQFTATSFTATYTIMGQGLQLETHTIKGEFVDLDGKNVASGAAKKTWSGFTSVLSSIPGGGGTRQELVVVSHVDLSSDGGPKMPVSLDGKSLDQGIKGGAIARSELSILKSMASQLAAGADKAQPTAPYRALFTALGAPAASGPAELSKPK